MSYTNDELLALCSKNPELKKFVQGTITKYKNDGIELNNYKNYDWAWDVEIDMYDESLPYTTECMMICNGDMIDDENDGWEVASVDEDFLKYLENNYWSKNTLDNGHVLFLINEDFFTYFQAFSLEKLKDGKVDGELCGFGPYSIKSQN